MQHIKNYTHTFHMKLLTTQFIVHQQEPQDQGRRQLQRLQYYPIQNFRILFQQINIKK